MIWPIQKSPESTQAASKLDLCMRVSSSGSTPTMKGLLGRTAQS